MNYVIFTHSLLLIIAFIIGLYIFTKPKGTKSHKFFGRLFVILMLVSLIASFFIKTDGTFSLIHILSALTIYWLVRAVVVSYQKKKNWRKIHAYNMTSAFIGIIIAGSGVLGRHYIFPGKSSYGFIISGVISIPTIYIARKLLAQYFHHLSKDSRSSFKSNEGPLHVKEHEIS